LGRAADVAGNLVAGFGGAAGAGEVLLRLVLVNALSKEWSYFFPPGGGKVVYGVLEIA
jgi:hypothetical protein